MTFVFDIIFTVDNQPLRDHPPGRVVTGLTTIVASVPWPERLKGQHAIVFVYSGHSGGRAQRTAGIVFGPRDGQRQVATDHRARDAGPLAHVRRPFRLQRAEPWRNCNFRPLHIWHAFFRRLYCPLKTLPLPLTKLSAFTSIGTPDFFMPYLAI